jgi:hypothetical protein
MPTPANSTCGSADGFDEVVPDSESSSSPRCQHYNQLGHYDWGGRPHPNLPEWCRPTIDIKNGPEAATLIDLPMASQIAVDESAGKISLQL